MRIYCIEVRLAYRVEACKDGYNKVQTLFSNGQHKSVKRSYSTPNHDSSSGTFAVAEKQLSSGKLALKVGSLQHQEGGTLIIIDDKSSRG